MICFSEELQRELLRLMEQRKSNTGEYNTNRGNLESLDDIFSGHWQQFSQLLFIPRGNRAIISIPVSSHSCFFNGRGGGG